MGSDPYRIEGDSSRYHLYFAYCLTAAASSGTAFVPLFAFAAAAFVPLHQRRASLCISGSRAYTFALSRAHPSHLFSVRLAECIRSALAFASHHPAFLCAVTCGSTSFRLQPFRIQLASYLRPLLLPQPQAVLYHRFQKRQMFSGNDPNSLARPYIGTFGLIVQMIYEVATVPTLAICTMAISVLLH